MESPVFTYCPPNITKKVVPGQSTSVVNWSKARVTDNSNKNPSVICNIEPGARFNIGLTVVVCEATDGSGNKANCSFYIKIIGKVQLIVN